MTPDHDPQTTTQKLTTMAAGVGGMSLSLSDISTVAQQVGMIVGCILVSGQAYIFFRDQFRKFRKGRPSNDR